MKVIAGLGNPGAEYAQTPHNAGFGVVDLLAERLAGDWRPSTRFQARLARVSQAGEEWLLVQPQTFMNLSGASVAPVLRYHGCALTDLVVVLDDADLPLGRLRIRAEGGSGGHRGLASVIEALGTQDFARVRLGVGRAEGTELVDRVLGRLPPEQRPVMATLVAKAADAVECWATNGVAEAMNRFNGWQAPAAGQSAGT